MGFVSIKDRLVSFARPGRRQPRAAEQVKDTAPIYVDVALLPKQLAFYHATEKHVALVGGIGSGKTLTLMAYVGKALHRERGRWTLGLVGANTYQQLTQSTLPKLWELIDDRFGLVEGVDYVYNEAPPRFWGKWPTKFKKKHDGVLSMRYWGQVIMRSLDNIDTIRGVELGWAALDEVRDASREDYDVVLGRLRCRRASVRELRMATSPAGFNWLYEEFVVKPPPSTRLIQVRSDENPYLPEGYVEGMLATYDPEFAKQEVSGEFVSLAKGRAYRNFERTKHAGVLFNADPGAAWQVSFDFNRTPYCVSLMQTVDHGRLVMVSIVDEVRLINADTATAAREVCRLLKSHAPDVPNKPRPAIEVFGDPSGRNHNTRGNQSDYDIISEIFAAEFGTAFIPSWAYSDPGIIGRVNAVNGVLLNALGEVRLRVHPRCRYTIEDFEQVCFKPGTRELDKTTNKMITHLSDAVAYYVADRYPAVYVQAAGGLMI